MEDSRIVELYFERSESAIEETEKKYGFFCYSIANNILHSSEDSNECVNDTCLRTWNSIPPTRPKSLRAFLAKITRNLALDRYEKNRAIKRFGCELVFDELEDCIPDSSQSDDTDNCIMLRDALNSFLGSLAEEERIIFLKRYWFMESVTQIASKCGVSESKTKVVLFRVRKKLKAYLEKEDITI